MRPFILLAVFFLAVLLPIATYPAFASSIVHGHVYEWSTFDTVGNAEVTVNSLPQQVMVTKNGSYSFNLDKGTYSVVARSGGNSTDALYANEDVTITQDGGDYVIDLILFPSSDFSDIDYFDENITPIATAEPADMPTAQPPQQSPGLGPVTLAAVILVIILIVGAGAFMVLRKKKPPATPTLPERPAPPPPPVEPVSPPPPPTVSGDVTLPDDLREVVRIIEKNGGRITQLDLRKALPYSEAKVSLMITDLESRGIVKKVKKGRGNIIILSRQENNAG